MRLTLRVSRDGTAVETVATDLVIAGFTGRDSESVGRHIDELVAHGVRRPERVPDFYNVDLGQLTFGGEIEVDGAETSGEVEPVLYCTPAGWFIGVGSDQTDRRLERQSIALSKQRCPKIASPDVLPLEDVEAQWDDLRLRSFADGAPYQDAPISELLPVRTIVEQLPGRDARLGLVVFLGTVPLVEGGFRFAKSYRCELTRGNGDVVVSHSYRVRRRT